MNFEKEFWKQYGHSITIFSNVVNVLVISDRGKGVLKSYMKQFYFFTLPHVLNVSCF